MSTELCLIHANCQVVPLSRLLLASPHFRARWHIRSVVNYKREPLPDDLLQTATLFLYQNLTAKWEELASENVLRQLSGTARRLCIPNPFFKGYWPLWTNTLHGTHTRFGDIFLDHLLDMELELPQILHIYLEKPLAAKFDLHALLEESWLMESRRETPCAVKTLPFVRAHWQQEQLFSTINHPSPRVLRFLVNGILHQLDLPALQDGDIRAAGLCEPHDLSCDPAPDEVFEMPIHPQVGAFFGLAFADKNRRYLVPGGTMSIREYVTAYVKARKLNVDLLPFLYALNQTKPA